VSEAVLSAFVTNLGKYNEGHLVGEWLKLPTDTETVQALFSRVGIDGVRYEEQLRQTDSLQAQSASIAD
jgi:hypothetical protein